MRLLLVTNDYPPKPGGIQQYLANLVEAYPHDVLVIAPRHPGAPQAPAIVRHPRRSFMWPTRSLARWVVDTARPFRPEAILFGAPHPLPWMAPRLRAVLQAPVGVIAHGAEITIPAAVPAVRSLLQSTMNRADVVFAVSDYTAGKVARLLSRDVVRLGGGVDVDTFRPPAKLPERSVPVVGCVSRFVPRKGQHRLLEAAAVLNERGTPVELLFVGRGRTEEALRKKAAALGVRARFEVDVPWDRLPGLYGEMDIFCVPCRSRWGGLEVEGLGLVYLEAAAAGLPVLAGDSGGSPETVMPGTTGFVVHSVDDIVEGLQMLIGDPERAMHMGRAGRARVERDFTWDAVVQRLLAGFATV